MALWGGRFTEGPDQRFKDYNDSLKFDYRLALEDIEGSECWADAIHEAGVLNDQECADLKKALVELHTEVEQDIHAIARESDEDIQSYVERRLIEKVGNLGKKLHTGRSRNDQVALDLKLWCRKAVVRIGEALVSLEQELVKCADKYQGALFPGYTHLQRAQPVTFSHWILAYVQMFERDYQRLMNAADLMSTCPLGSAALAGTAYRIDRQKLALALGFKAATSNSLDGVSDRDHVIELLSCASISMMHLSRLAEDLIIYNSGEAHFVELSDKVTSGSSLMPQKKNPDVCELIRGKTGRVYGSLMTLLTVLKGLPLAYNKDMQEDKEAIFDAFDTVKMCLTAFIPMIDTMTVLPQNMRKAAAGGFINATDCADYLTKKGVPVRDAYQITGTLVAECVASKKGLSDLSLEEFRAHSDVFDKDIYEAIDLITCVRGRKVPGGPAPEEVERQIRRIDAFIAERGSAYGKTCNLH